MNFDQAKTDIINWVSGFVEQPHPLLNGWAPCPYARRARIDGLFDIRPGSIDPLTDCQSVGMDSYDVIAYVYDPAQFLPGEFNNAVRLLNRNFLSEKNMLALADHPGDMEMVNGVIMNQGTWAICFLQDLDKLNSHAAMLAKKGYYHGWSEDYLSDLFEGRADPRDTST